MLRFLVHRIAQMILVTLGATLILFVALFVLPGNPVENLAGSDKARDPTVVAELTARYGLNDPIVIQYVHYVERLAKGDLGEDYLQRRSVNEILGPKLKNTARLALFAILIDAAIGLFAGFISALFRYSFWDVFVTILTTMAIGFPTFVIGRILQTYLGVKYHVFPIAGTGGLDKMIMPAFTLAIVDAALVARLMRGTMLEVMRADYVKTAIAKGVPRRAVLFKHVTRNSVIPVVTYLGISLGTLMGGALITESIFNWDGVGYALVNAVQQGNNPIITAVVTYSVAVFILLNLLVDILYAVLDPRIRLS